MLLEIQHLAPSIEAFCRKLSSASMFIVSAVWKSMATAGTASVRRLISVDFEVFGRVQGVFFRKYTQLKGKELGLLGWVANTSAGTVTGQLQGDETAVRKMKEWLRNTGSPASRIESCAFRNERTIDSCAHRNFSVRH